MYLHRTHSTEWVLTYFLCKKSFHFNAFFKMFQEFLLYKQTTNQQQRKKTT